MKLLRKVFNLPDGKWVKPKFCEPSIESAFYHALTQRYNSIGILKNIADSTLASTEICESGEIRFNGLEFGDPIKKARRALGIPNLIHTSQNVSNYRILFYRSISEQGAPFGSELHFHNNSLVLGVERFENTEENRKRCKGRILRECGVHSFPDHAVIKDSAENYVSLQSGEFCEAHYMDLHYLSQLANAIYAAESAQYRMQHRAETPMVLELA